MPVSGLVITLSNDPDRAASAAARLAAATQLELGPAAVGGRVVPAVLDTTGRAEDQRIHAWIKTLPGVETLDVTFIHFDDPDERSA